MADAPSPADDAEEPYPTRVWRDYTSGSRQMKDPAETAFNADIQAKHKDDYKKAWSKMKLIPKTPSMPYGKDCLSFAELEDYVTANGQRDRLKCNGYSQEIFQDWVVNPFLDLDDATDNEEDARQQTKVMLDWANTELPPLLGLSNREARDTVAVSCTTRANPDPKKTGWKVSVHVCVNGIRVKWADQPEYFKQKGVLASMPRKFKNPDEDIFDESIYKNGGVSGQILRLVNNHNPDVHVRLNRQSLVEQRVKCPEGSPEFAYLTVQIEVVEKLMVTQGLTVGDEKDDKSQVRVFQYQDNHCKKAHTRKTRFGDHVPTIGLSAGCVTVEVVHPAPAQKTPVTPQKTPDTEPATPDSSSKKKTKKELVAGASLGKEDLAEMLENQKEKEKVTKTERVEYLPSDVVKMLALIDADIGHTNRLAVAYFLKSKCTRMFDDDGRQLWLDMTQRYKLIEHKQDLAEQEGLWDRITPKDNVRGYTFRTLIWLARKRNPKAVKQWQSSFLAALSPFDLTQWDFADYLKNLLPALKCDSDSKNFSLYDDTTGIWSDISHGELADESIRQLRVEIGAVILKLTQGKQVLIDKSQEFEEGTPEFDELFKEIEHIEYIISGKGGWKTVLKNCGHTWNNAIIDRLGSRQGIATKNLDLQWNDNNDNTLTWILPFANGVVDLRDEYPQKVKVASEEMMIKYHVGYAYVETWEGMEKDMADIVKYRMATVDDGPGEGGQYDWCLFKDSTMLLGMNAFEEMQMYTGGGQNGKTTEVNLKLKVLGNCEQGMGLMGELKPDYYQTGKQDPNQASSYLSKLKYCREIYSEEPTTEKAPLLGGRIKKICGRNFLESRGNYQQSGGFIPGWDAIFCANKIPDICGGEEFAIYRRLIVRPFEYCFLKTKAEQMGMTYREPAWTKFQLDEMVASDGFRNAYLHLCLRTLGDKKNQELISTLPNSKEHPAFPPEWKAATEDKQRQDPLYRWISEHLVFTHEPHFVDRVHKFLNKKTKKFDANKEEHPQHEDVLGRKPKKGEFDEDAGTLLPGMDNLLRKDVTAVEKREGVKSVWGEFDSWRRNQGIAAWQCGGGQDDLFLRILSYGGGQFRRDNGTLMFTGIMFASNPKALKKVDDPDDPAFRLPDKLAEVKDKESFNRDFADTTAQEEAAVNAIVKKGLTEKPTEDTMAPPVDSAEEDEVSCATAD